MLRAKSTAEAKLTHRCGSSSGDGFALFDSAGLVKLLDERDRSRGKHGLGEASKASVDAAEVEQRETGEYTRMNNIRLDAAQGGRGGREVLPHHTHRMFKLGANRGLWGSLMGMRRRSKKLGLCPLGTLDARVDL